MSRLNSPGHVIAAFLELNHSLTIVASLPALFFRHLHYALGLLVLWALSSRVILAVAQDTYFGAASTTASVLSSRGQVNTDLIRFNPFATAFSRAIKIFGSCVLFKFLVPKPLELIVEQAVDML